MSGIILTNKLIIDSYLNAILWTEELDSDYSIEDFDEDSLNKATKEVLEFVDNHTQLLDDNNPSETLDSMAHDFWLTRNHHGTGFWDDKYSNGIKLTSLAEEYKEQSVYVENGKVYID